ncbi:uncharacterized protein LOC126681703 [Mercurialis annua]|uniref:uncharacterized protein LOC126681703 n=1 Tax=Mercurialis annua TaxID=3986 RepID=UPI002160937F|nr:uncharacterized protein LOC126681703 [Mercurialis annua]
MNEALNMKALWSKLTVLRVHVEKPWIVLGDFNAVFRDSDRCGGNIANQNDCEEFQNCLDNTNLIELKSRGNKHTWTNNQQGEDRIWRRIDRVLVSEKWLDIFDAEASVLSQGISDHAALIVKFNEPVIFSFKTFRFFNMWDDSKDFMEIVNRSWRVNMEGHKMYQVVQKLKRLKKEFRDLNRDSFCEISVQVSKAREGLKGIQDPMNAVLLGEEQALVMNFRKLLRLEDNFYKQKSRVQWIELCDLNTKFLHKSLLQRQSSNRITHLRVDGVIIEDQDRISDCIVEYYKEHIGK